MAGQTVTISVLADTRKFSSAMKGLAGETGLGRVASGVGNIAKAVGTTVAAVGVSLATMALTGGFKRALAIEDAQAALRGLGHDARSIDRIMESALASVKGTAFGLGDAATIASTAVAAGIEPGEELTRILTITANTAALARVGLDDMGSVLNKVWTNGKASTQELNQIADRGIPIWTSLAEHYQVSGEELRKMVSQGKVDAETFADVLENTVGTAAEEMGKTTRGSWQNFLAALSRGGEKFLSGIFPMFATGLQGITDLVDRIGPFAERVGQALGQWVTGTAMPALQRLGDWFTTVGLPALQAFGRWLQAEVVPRLQGLWSAVQTRVLPVLAALGDWITGPGVQGLRSFGQWVGRNQTWLKALAVVVGTLVVAFGAYLKVMAIWRAVTVVATAVQKLFNTVLLANPIGLIIAAIAALVAGLIWFFTQTEIGRQIWETVWSAIQTAVAAVVDWWQNTVQPIFLAVWEAISAAATSVAAWYQEHVAPVFEAVGELLSAIFERVAGVVRWLWGRIFKPYLTFIVNLWTTIWNGIRAVWDRIGPPIMGAIGVAIENVKVVWTGIWNAIKSFFEGVWNGIKNVVETVLGVIRGVIQAVTSAIRGDWSGAWEAIKNALSRAWEGMVNGVRTAIETVGNIVTSIKDTVLGVFSNAWEWLVNAGRDLLTGLWNGISSKFDWIRDKVRELGANIVDSVKSIFGIRSPSRVFRGIGEDLTAGLALGLRKVAEVRKAVRTLTVTVDDGFDPHLAFDNPRPSGGGNTYHLTVQAGVGDPVAIGREVSKALDAFERQNGRR